jgi:hypothetical protein
VSRFLVGARLVFAVGAFPIIRIADWVTRCDPPAQLRTGIDWARGEKS